VMGGSSGARALPGRPAEQGSRHRARVMRAVRPADGNRGPAGGGKAVPYTAGRWLWEAPGGLRPSAPAAARRA